jgi:fucose permease
LTFWAAVIKRVTMIADADEQGRFFGFLDGGRGLIEAMLATIAITLFAWTTQTRGESVATGFKLVVYMYAFLCIALGVILGLVKDPTSAKTAARSAVRKRSNVLVDLLTLAKIPELWLVGAIVFCGYQVFWATYSFSAYLHEGAMGLSVVMAGAVTTLKLWMRPIGGIGGGFLGDRFSKISALMIALFLAALSLLGLVAAPGIGSHVALVFLVLFIGILTYAIRGLYWSLLDRCNVPIETMGLAIGLISVLGYSPDVFLPLINGYLTQTFPGVFGYQLYFGYVAAVAVLGSCAALVLRNMLNRKEGA